MHVASSTPRWRAKFALVAPARSRWLVSSDRITPPAPRVAGVFVVWRSLGITLAAVRSLLESSVRLDPLICVAQELSQEDLALLAAAMPDGELITLEDNLGFAAAANLGIARAVEIGCTWVLIANNDAVIAATCVARCLDEAARHERTAVVSPAIAYSGRPDRLWFAGASQSRLFAVVWHRGIRSRADAPPPSSASDYIPSCTALMSIAAYADVGPMRDDYFMYFEDVEWGDRARRQGWQLRYLGEVLSHHEMGGSSEHGGSRVMSENTAYYMARNALRFALDSPSTRLRATRVFGALVIWTAYNLSRIRPAEWSTAGRALFQGLLDGWAGRMGRRDLAHRK
jgi:hypothetical protein